MAEPNLFTLKVCPDCGHYETREHVRASQVDLDTQRSLTGLADLRARGLEGLFDGLIADGFLTDPGREVVRLALGKSA